MARTIKLNGRQVLISGPYSVADLKRLYLSFCRKYGRKLSFGRWLVERGKVY